MPHTQDIKSISESELMRLRNSGMDSMQHMSIYCDDLACKWDSMPLEQQKKYVDFNGFAHADYEHFRIHAEHI